MTVEIYLCKEGQSLKEGRLEYSGSIHSKDDAAADAQARCQRDASLHKIAYYKVSPDGEFRVFFSYVNPKHQKSAPAVRPAAAQAPARRPSVKRPAPKVGLFRRILRSMGLG